MLTLNAKSKLQDTIIVVAVAVVYVVAIVISLFIVLARLFMSTKS